MPLPTVAMILYPQFNPIHFAMTYAVFSAEVDGAPLFDLKIVAPNKAAQKAERALHAQADGGLALLAAADIVVFLEPVAHVFTAGLDVLVKQGLGRHDETGGAKTALRRAVLYPGMLQGMQIGRRTDAFKRGDGCIFSHTAHLDNAGARHLAVNDDGTSAALPFAAANLYAGELQLAAQHVHQSIIGADQQTPGNAVHYKSFWFHARLLY